MRNKFFSKKILSWCFFDFANSSYSVVIAAVIFPVYYAMTVVGNQSGSGDVWWGRAISLSMAVVAVSSPFLGGIADHAKMRKKLLFIYTMLCVIPTAMLFFVREGMAFRGFILIVLANIGMEGGIVFYNAFLKDISDNSYQGRVSAWGFGTGYLGSIIALFLGLLIYRAGYVNLVWPMVAVFFAVFSTPAFLFLPADEKSRTPILQGARTGLRTTLVVLKKIIANEPQRRFLIAYLIYEDGVNTAIVFSGIFAATTLFFKQEELVGLYLIIQATALIGAFLMAKPIDNWGPKKVAGISLVLWIVTVAAIYFTQNKTQFFVIASIAGLGLGTIQASSRAFFAQFIPPGNESEYFGVYSLVGKSSAVLGPLLFGFVSSLMRSQRPAVLSIAFLFVAGLIVMQFAKGGGPNVAQSAER
ncbi:MAG TPA: MFS transporter [Syntrophorhabdaceae bacterium]|nr:MFS transporter [Syntrophorhabdaceae bacterium]